MAHYRKSLISVFQEVFASINKFFILAGASGTDLWFYKVQKLSWYSIICEDRNSEVVQQLVRQLVYTMSIGYNCASFHLWWQENLVKHKKGSKYYENAVLENFALLLMSFLITKSIKKVINRLKFTLSFQ